MDRIKKMLVVVLSVVLLSNAVASQKCDASWFSDLFGGIFTILTAPLQLVAPDNPTLRKNNPFRKKAWQEADDFYISHTNEEDERDKQIKKMKEDLARYRRKSEAQYQVEVSSRAALVAIVNKQREEIVGLHLNIENINEKFQTLTSSSTALVEVVNEQTKTISSQGEQITSQNRTIIDLRSMFANISNQLNQTQEQLNQTQTTLEEEKAKNKRTSKYYLKDGLIKGTIAAGAGVIEYSVTKFRDGAGINWIKSKVGEKGAFATPFILKFITAAGFILGMGNAIVCWW
jgi:hypothetical protein